MAPHGQGPAGDPARSVPVSFEPVARPLRKTVLHLLEQNIFVLQQLCRLRAAARRPSLDGYMSVPSTFIRWPGNSSHDSPPESEHLRL